MGFRLHAVIAFLKSTIRRVYVVVVFAPDYMVEITSHWVRLHPMPKSFPFSSSRLLWLLSTVRIT